MVRPLQYGASMNRCIAFLLSITLTTGCSAVARKHRGAAAVADAMATAGVLMTVPNLGCQEVHGDDVWFDCLEEDLAVTGGIALLAIAATAGMIILASQPDDEPAEVTPTIVTVAAAPSAAPIAAPLPSLPEAAVDAPTLQLARQARRATVEGDCPAARASLASVARRDPAYYAALIASDAVAGCR